MLIKAKISRPFRFIDVEAKQNVKHKIYTSCVFALFVRISLLVESKR